MWTENSEIFAGGAAEMKSLLQERVDSFNIILENSGANVEFNPAYFGRSELIGEADPSSFLDMLVFTRKGRVDTIQAFVKLNGLDHINFTQMTRFTSGAAGLADFPYSGINFNSGFYYKTVYYHEFCHSIGCGHERDYVENGGEPDKYNYAYRFFDSTLFNYRYTITCQLGISELVIPYISNPDINFNGHPLGFPEGSIDENGNPNSADNVRYINEFGANRLATYTNRGINCAIIPKYYYRSPGQVQEYQVKFANSLAQSFKNVRIKINENSKGTIESVSDGGRIEGNSIIWENLGDIGPGEVGHAVYGKILTFSERVLTTGKAYRGGSISADDYPAQQGAYYVFEILDNTHIIYAESDVHKDKIILKYMGFKNIKLFDVSKTFDIRGKKIGLEKLSIVSGKILVLEKH